MAIAQIQACRLLSFSVKNCFRWIRLPAGWPAIISGQTRSPSPIAHLRAKGFSWHENTECTRSFFAHATVTVSSLRDHIVLPDFCTAKNIGEDSDLLRVLLVCILCMISVSSNRVMCSNNPFGNGTIVVCRAKTVFDNKHWYYVPRSVVMVRSGLPLLEVLRNLLVQSDRRLLPVVSLKLPMLHSHPQVPAESGGTHDSLISPVFLPLCSGASYLVE